MYKETIESKNKLDALIYQTKSTIENDEIKGKLEESELKLVSDLLIETELWLDSDHTKEEYETKMTEVNGKINPIMMKVYSEGSGPGHESVNMTSEPTEPTDPSEPDSVQMDPGPTLDEVD
jgi:heat shock protein 1/8